MITEQEVKQWMQSQAERLFIECGMKEINFMVSAQHYASSYQKPALALHAFEGASSWQGTTLAELQEKITNHRADRAWQKRAEAAKLLREAAELEGST